MLYTNFQRKILEENMTKIENFGKKLEPNLKKLYAYMIENKMESFMVADFDKGSKYLDNFRVNAEILDMNNDKKGLRVAYRQEEISEFSHSINNNLIVTYTEDDGVDIFYVDERLYEYTLGLSQLCTTALNTVHVSGSTTGDGSFQEKCQQMLIDFLKVDK